jgi:hypothetical protein
MMGDLGELMVFTHSPVYCLLRSIPPAPGHVYVWSSSYFQECHISEILIISP